MGGDVGIIDYGIGNLRSVANAVTTVGGVPHFVTSPDEIDTFDRIILPGVGAFIPAIEALRSLGMAEALEGYVSGGKPLLGICLGMQLMCRRSLEDGETKGLGWISADVLPFRPDGEIRVPHMGWNTLHLCRQHDIVAGLPDGADVYFLHSYYVACDTPEDMVASCDYGVNFAAIIARGHIFGMQFHPEKSQEAGLLLLQSFLNGVSA
jgi:glutamine amidotransferase